MKISICDLGNEECETCEAYKQHKSVCSCSEECNTQVDYLKHVEKYTNARKNYELDKDKSKWENSEIRVAADLQKVILLPRMDTFKKCVFTPRLVVFNETFAELGKGGLTQAVIWHEEISDRKCEDIASAFHRWAIGLRDIKKIVLWVDNCSGHNKNCYYVFKNCKQ